MIKELEIENFKSIKQLKLDCRRINLFIGEPNTGKSNILEAIGWLSSIYYSLHPPKPLKDFVRMESMINLFHDEDLEAPIKVRADNLPLEIKRLQTGMFAGEVKENGSLLVRVDYSNEGNQTHLTFERSESWKPFKFYRFVLQEKFPEREADFPIPPHGGNLSLLLLTHKGLRSEVSKIFNHFGLKLIFKRLEEERLEVAKAYEEDVFISFPYFLASETLQRIVFHLVAILSNQDSVIAFEEPEAHAFPYYTKFLAEEIALNERGNQYFISTHNPFLLVPLLEKAKEEDINVFLTYLENFETKVKPLTTEQKERVLDFGEDIFFNLEKFLEE